MRLTAICLRNLTRRKLRTSLCIFGVAIASCLIIAVGATTSRYVEIIMEMNMFFRGKIVVVPRKAIVIQGFPIGGIFQQNAVDSIKTISGVEKVVPMIVVFGFELGENPTIIPANVTIGLPVTELSLIIGFATLSGRVPMENSTNEVIVGCSIAKQYGISVGSKIHIAEKEFIVCGIVEGPSAVIMRSVIMSLEEAQNIFRYNGFISMAVVELKRGAAQDAVAGEIESRIAYVTALTDEERNALTKPIIDFVESWKLAIQAALLFLSMVLTAIVGVMSVSERRRDFATLDAIGARSSQIFRIILLENSLIGFLGSLLGIVFGVVVAAFLASFYTAIPINQFLSSFFAIVNPLFMVEIVGLVVASCCVGGVIPAINASKIRISEILRAEY